MNKVDFENVWRSLKREIDEKPLSQALGLNLIRGELLETSHMIEKLHLQVFGKDTFLRNMLQRILLWDIRRFVSIILVASEKETGLLEEIVKIFNDFRHSRENILLLHSRHRPRRSVQPFKACDLFEREMSQKLQQNHLYIEMGDTFSSNNQILIQDLKSEIKRRFAEEEDSPVLSYKPFVCIFRPEALPKDYLISDFTNNLKDCACFRIFSNEVQILSREESGLVYGPELYPAERLEEMRKHCHWRFERNEKNKFLSKPGNQEVLKMAKDLAKTIPLNQTAFGRFRDWYWPGWKYAWFYPVQQGLGRLPYNLPSEFSKWRNKPEHPAVAIPKSGGEDPALLKIIEDLRPKK